MECIQTPSLIELVRPSVRFGVVTVLANGRAARLTERMYVIQIVFDAIKGKQTRQLEKQVGVLINFRLVPFQPEHLGNGEFWRARIAELIQNLVTLFSYFLGDTNLFEKRISLFRLICFSLLVPV